MRLACEIKKLSITYKPTCGTVIKRRPTGRQEQCFNQIIRVDKMLDS
jgi:hypothetical protein